VAGAPFVCINTPVTTSRPRRDSVQSLERGIAVIELFSRERPALTLSDVARLTGISRSAARRILLTLTDLGHVRCDGRLFSLTPRVLSLGWAYLSALSLLEVCQPLMQDLTRRTNESCAVATLDLPDIVTVSRVPTQRLTTVLAGPGSRLPAYCTAIGRVLLGDLDDEALDAYLASVVLEPLTERTIVDPERLREVIVAAREDGWALVDQELELGLRAVAAPVRAGDGHAVAAMNLAVSTSTMTLAQLRKKLVPELLSSAALATAALQGQRPHGGGHVRRKSAEKAGQNGERVGRVSATVQRFA
jgi:IclR family pca regulon transcriptional regulator